MGFFSDIGNFFNHDVKNFFSSAITKISHPGDTLKSVIHDIGDVASSITNPIENRISTVVNTLHTDARDFVGAYNKTVNQVINKGGDLAHDVVKTTGSTVSNLGQSLSMPLLLVGGAAALFLLMKK